MDKFLWFAVGSSCLILAICGGLGTLVIAIAITRERHRHPVGKGSRGSFME